ncbi:MAG: HTH domain-containing protein [Bacteroidales bacterium]|nr:HTH domain-containing protein [Bacteroidales bacterium]MBN2698594.1 HTH domain-containing protein [Bacteroidales bacterium]
MSEQNTLYRTLEMMAILSRPGGVTTRELAEHYEMSIRTIQRTIWTIREAGYIVDEHKGRYSINRAETKKRNMFDIGDLLHFSKEEAELLNRAIQGIPGRNAIKENLTRKLYSLYGSENVVNNLVRQEDSVQVRILIEAIQNRLQVKVTEYTMSTANRGMQKVVIEPIEFASDYSRLWAYFPEQRKNFLLRLSGINGVEAMHVPWQCAQYHKVGYIDVFRGYGFDRNQLRWIMNRRAFGFMLEEFPLAWKYITRLDPKTFRLDTEVCNFFQPARFYLGLPGDIKVEEPVDFPEYVKNKDWDRDFDEDMAYAVSFSPVEKQLLRNR